MPVIVKIAVMTVHVAIVIVVNTEGVSARPILSVTIVSFAQLGTKKRMHPPIVKSAMVGRVRTANVWIVKVTAIIAEIQAAMIAIAANATKTRRIVRMIMMIMGTTMAMKQMILPTK